MFIVLYRWRVREGFEQEFIEAWTERTVYFRGRYDSLGSRLHRGNDGLFYSYAQWRSAEQREKAFTELADFAPRTSMNDLIEESFPEVILETAADFLLAPEK